jgi:hypothetical protein
MTMEQNFVMPPVVDNGGKKESKPTENNPEKKQEMDIEEFRNECELKLKMMDDFIAKWPTQTIDEALKDYKSIQSGQDRFSWLMIRLGKQIGVAMERDDEAGGKYTPYRDAVKEFEQGLLGRDVVSNMLSPIINILDRYRNNRNGWENDRTAMATRGSEIVQKNREILYKGIDSIRKDYPNLKISTYEGLEDNER